MGTPIVRFVSPFDMPQVARGTVGVRPASGGGWDVGLLKLRRLYLASLAGKGVQQGLRGGHDHGLVPPLVLAGLPWRSGHSLPKCIPVGRSRVAGRAIAINNNREEEEEEAEEEEEEEGAGGGGGGEEAQPSPLLSPTAPEEKTRS